MKNKLQNFGKTLLFPISLMSFMAIFLGLAAALQNPNIIGGIGFINNRGVQVFLGLIRKLAVLPFAQLPLLFAMAIPLGMVKKDREVAVYSSVVGYIALLMGMNYMLDVNGVNLTTTSIGYLMDKEGLSQVDATLRNSLYTNVLGIFVYNMNVIGGVISGLVTVKIHNRYRQQELHSAMTFYSGKRFVPIMNAIVNIIIGMILVFIWPYMNRIILSLGGVISDSGIIGAFLYGFFEKLINPTGLHHILNQAFRFTALGGMEEVAGKMQVGALNIYLSQLSENLPFSTNATKYLAQGKILHMVFGCPAIVYAIYKNATTENRKKVINYFIPAITAVVLTGITEPIEFTFIFISPLLWIVNAVFAGLSFVGPAILEVAIGNVQGGIIDWFVFGVLQGTQTKWYVYLYLGPIYFAMYYFTFNYIIKKRNIMTIGKGESDFSEDENEDIEFKNLEGEESRLGALLVEGLGGIDNIIDVDNCISRLRIEVKDSKRTSEEILQKTKPNGIIRPDENNIQIVYGGKVVKMRNILDDYISNLKK